MHGLKYALRALSRSRGFASVAVLTLALGIGANTSIFSLLYQILFRSLPVEDPESLVVFHTDAERLPGSSFSDNAQSVFSYPMYRDLRDRSEVFEGVIARFAAPVSLRHGGETERVSAEIVSGNYFQVLGIAAVCGRVITHDDDRTPGAHPVAVLSHGYWTRRFGATTAILGQTVAVNGHPMVVIGVTPPGFRGLVSGQTPALFVPIAMKRQVTPAWDGLGDRAVRWLNIFARLKPGLPIETAEAATEVLYRPIFAEELAQVRSPDRSLMNQSFELWPAARGINQMQRRWQAPLVTLMGMVALVLFITCANLANLLLARAADRRREMSIRLALGASRAAILRQLVAESLLLSLAGGSLGLLVAQWVTDALLALVPASGNEGWLSAEFDLRLLAFNLALSLLTGVLFGLAPALRACRTDLGAGLRSQSSAATARAAVRKVLVVVQVALALLLLVGAGLFARSLGNLTRFDAGFRTEGILTFSLNPRSSGYAPSRVLAFYGELRERIAALPEVRAVGAVSPGPLSGARNRTNIQNHRTRVDRDAVVAFRAVSPGYFEALGIGLVAGRDFSERDTEAAPGVVVVNEAFAREYGGGASPIGLRLAFGGGGRMAGDREVVGVVADSNDQSLREPVRPVLFLPYTQSEMFGPMLDVMTFCVLTDGEKRLGPAIRSLVADMDAGLPVFDMKSMQVRIDESIFRDRLVAFLAAAFGVLATLLAALGVHAVVAYTVARRTAEFGVRIALGALPRSILWLVMRDVSLLLGTGIAIGLPAALGFGRLIESQLFGLESHDPVVLVGAAVSLAAATLISGYIPGLRAAHVEPVQALRYE